MARLFRRRQIGVDDGTGDDDPDLVTPQGSDGSDSDPEGSTAAAGSVVSAGTRPTPIAIPQKSQYERPEDEGLLSNLLGQKPVQKPQGNLGKTLSVLSDIFLRQDIPQDLRDKSLADETAAWGQQVAPVQARIKKADTDYNEALKGAMDTSTIQKNSQLADLYSRRGPAPAHQQPTHYYGGVDESGNPTEMSVNPNLEGATPQVVGPRYEAPHNPPGAGNVDDQTFAYLTAPAPKGKGMTADAAYSWIQRQKGLTGEKVEAGKTAHNQAEYSRAHAQAARELAPEGKNLLGKFYDDQGNFDAEGFAAAIDSRAQQLLDQQAGQGGQGGKPAHWNGSAWVDGTGQPIAAAR